MGGGRGRTYTKRRLNGKIVLREKEKVERGDTIAWKRCDKKRDRGGR